MPEPSRSFLLSNRFADREDSGTVIVLVTLGLTLLLSLLALAVDIALYATVKTEQQAQANQIALASLEGYFENDSTDPHTKLYNGAKPKARTVAEESFQPSLGSRRQQSSAVAQNDLQISPSNSTAYGANGKIIPGQWHFSEPVEGCANYCNSHFCPAGACPCGGQTWKGPCFALTSDSQTVNAIKVEYRTDPASGIQSIMGAAVGKDAFFATSTATAAVTPRRAVFAFDISRSVVRDTHGTVNQTGLPGDGYAFMVDPRFDNPAAVNCATAPIPNDITGRDWWRRIELSSSPIVASAMVAPPTPTPTPAGLEAHVLVPEDHSAFNIMSSSSSGISSLTNYRCVTVSNVGDEGYNYNSPSTYAIPSEDLSRWNNQTYLVDTARAPQPLTNILDGIHTALVDYDRRKVKGDQVGVFAFDDNILPSRATLTEAYDGTAGDSYTIGMIRTDQGSSVAEFDKVLKATDTTLPIQTRLNNKFFIPRAFGKTLDTDPSSIPYPYNRVPAATDMPQALEVALQMILYGRARPDLTGNRLTNWPDPLPEVKDSDNFVVLFTDLMTNCSANTAAGAATYTTQTLSGVERSCTPGAYQTEPLAPSWDKDADGVELQEMPLVEQRTNRSLIESAEVLKAYARYNIPVYLVAMGVWTGATGRPPAAMQLQKDQWDPAGHCMTFDKMYQYYTSTNTTLKNWISHPYQWFYIDRWAMQRPFSVANAYPAVMQGVMSTGGQFVQVMPSCSDSISGVNRLTMFNYGLGTSLTAADCQAGQLWNKLQEKCAAAPNRSSVEGSENHLRLYDGTQPWYYEDYTIGSRGQIRCDPLCRSSANQIAAVISQLMERNPYVLVSP